MAAIQKVKCPDCQVEFEFDPNEDNGVITSLNESVNIKLGKDKKVTAYLTCPNGHIKPYKVFKPY